MYIFDKINVLYLLTHLLDTEDIRDLVISPN